MHSLGRGHLSDEAKVKEGSISHPLIRLISNKQAATATAAAAPRNGTVGVGWGRGCVLTY